MTTGAINDNPKKTKSLLDITILTAAENRLFSSVFGDVVTL